MTYYVPNTGQGLLLGNHNPGLGFTIVHKPTCMFLPAVTTPFDGTVEGAGEGKVRRDFRVGRITGCAFCQPEVLIEGVPPHERHERALAANEALCGCGHKFVSHSLTSPHPCQMEERNDWNEDVQCECTGFVATVQVTTEPLRSPNPDDVILPGAFTPGPVPVRFPDGKVVEGHIDTDGCVTVRMPSTLLIREGDQFSIHPGAIRLSTD